MRYNEKMKVAKIITLSLDFNDLEKLNNIGGKTYTGILRRMIRNYERNEIKMKELEFNLRTAQDNYANLKTLIKKRDQLNDEIFKISIKIPVAE